MGLPSWPTTDFDAVLEANGRGTALRFPLLVYLDLIPTPMALWGGEYDLTSGDIVWRGIDKSGLLGAVENVTSAFSFDASETTLTLSGVDPDMIALLDEGDRGDYIGRLAGFYMQLCDDSWQPLCPPFAVSAGFMDSLRVDREWKGDPDKGQWVRTMKLPVWNLATGRGNAPASFYTDRDQQRRHPGDLGLTFIKRTQDVSLTVPWFKGA